jgi:hypothetical protein
MPRRKKPTPAAEKAATENTPAAGATNGKAAGQRGFKYQALREAIGALGRDAKNKDLEEHIRSKHGAGAVPANISVAKSNILKQMRGRKGKAKAKKAAAPAEVKGAPMPAARATDSFSMDDLRRVKELAGKLGKDRVKELVDLLA